MTCDDGETWQVAGALTAPERVTRLRSGRPPLQDGRRGRGGQSPHRRPSVGTDRARTPSRQRRWPRSQRGRRSAPKARAGPRSTPRPRGTAVQLSRWTTACRPLPAPAALVLAALGGLALDLAFPGSGWWPLRRRRRAAAGPRRPRRPGPARRSARAGLRSGLLRPAARLVGHLRRRAAVARARVVEAAFLAAARRRAARRRWRGARRRPRYRARRHRSLGAAGGAAGPLPFGGFPWGGSRSARPTAPFVGLGALGGAPLVSVAVAAPARCLAVAVVRVLRDGSGSHGPRPGPAVRRRPGRRGRGGPRRGPAGAAPSPAGDRPAARCRWRRAGQRAEAGLDFNAQRRGGARQPRRERRSPARSPSGPAARRAPTWWSGRRTPRDIDPLPQPGRARRRSTAAVDAVGVPDPGRRGRSTARAGLRRRNAGIVWDPATGPADSVRQAAPGAVRRVHPLPRRSAAGSATRSTWSRATSSAGTGPASCRCGAGHGRRRDLLRGRLRRPGPRHRAARAPAARRADQQRDLRPHRRGPPAAGDEPAAGGRARPRRSSRSRRSGSAALIRPGRHAAAP